MTKEVLLTYSEEDDPFLKRNIISLIEYAFGRRKLQKLYRKAIKNSVNGALFWQAALDELEITLSYDNKKLEKMPKTGPLLIIANHPFGVLDGLMICNLVSKIRTDFKVMLHKTLCREKILVDHTIPVDFQGTKEAILTNIESKKLAKKQLANGGALIIFPAGGVSTAKNIFGKAKDFPWKPFPARLIQEFKPNVMPFYFFGQNSPVFHAASKINEALRSSMYIREIKIKMGQEFNVNIGEPILAKELQDITNRQELTDHLYTITKELSSN